MNAMKFHLKDLFNLLIKFLKNPIDEIKSPPDWGWKKLLVTHVLITFVVGFFLTLLEMGFTSREFSMTGLVLGTTSRVILTFFTAMITSLFFFYSLQVFMDQKVLFRKIFTVVFFSLLPFFIFQIVRPFSSVVDLIGFGFTAFLLIVGLVENFSLEKKVAIKLIGALYALFFVVWLIGHLDEDRSSRNIDKIKWQAPEVQLGN